MYTKEINKIHRDLGIPEDYECNYGLSLQREEYELLEIGNDIYGRLQRLAPAAANAWKEMKYQAEKEGIILNVVSAFRAVNRQKEIIQKKIESGQPISEVLKVCAAPGYSEHHTGRALDLTSTGCEPLSEIFENTEAFSWLVENGGFYLFSLSYSKGNKAGILYEPWHWAYIPSKAT
ncbi:MAG: D-alanyl-D-alanine carboxypeptidase family protein [Gammaproteobacteria bacterium]|nr:D-alanyl-D-alanine carboxypeptidase family protein [Gammaproteobacteria bacterium]